MNKPLVLIIEDDPDVRSALGGALTLDFAVEATATGGAGLAAAKARTPALVLVDLGLPDLGGSELVAALRRVVAAPIIVISARHQETEKVAALDAGADDYLTKPFGNGELLARARAHLRRRTSASALDASEFSFGDVTIAFDARSVRRSGALVHLTPIEFKLLSILVANPDRVLTHAELLRQAWGLAYQDRPHYLRIHMAHLRQKLEATPTQPRHFVTETGVGYRFLR
jgi:two-component system, OmpR family, KDP operon response regulator KdpE